jgi:hypothetical protein
MSKNLDLIFDDKLRKCLENTAADIQALPTQREVLYTITSAASLIHILRTMFVYIDADIKGLKETVIPDSEQCLQRYARETLCPICVNKSSSSNNVNEPLCENDCQFLMKNCLNETNNPYTAFAVIAQGYSDVIKQIQKSIVELKVNEQTFSLRKKEKTSFSHLIAC